MSHDPINPPHYRSNPSGVECIVVAETLNFNLGNALKYIWRADEKGDPVENIRKAVWYLEREIRRRGLSGGSEATTIGDSGPHKNSGDVASARPA